MNYNVIKTKGQGGFGIVEHVQDKNGNDFARKTFMLSPIMNPIKEEAKKRFIKEAKVQKSIIHPNIVPIIETSMSSSPPWYIMKLADASMEEDIKNSILDGTNFLTCFYDIMAGLEEIHSFGIYHRDLKPGNVLRFNDHYAIGDFGLISLNKTGLTAITGAGMKKSSDFYTAPEITQDLRFASIQSDIYSLGCILDDLVGETSRIPCNEIMDTSIYGDLLRGATRSDPSRRFSSVSEFREAFNSIYNKPSVPKTDIAGLVLKSLKKQIVDYSEDDVNKLSDFLSSNIQQDEKDIILKEITIRHIEVIIANKVKGRYIAKYYCDFVRDNSFNFEFCDSLATRIIAFIQIGELAIVSDGIFALFYMGAYHNRFYVERKAIRYFCGTIEPRLLQRILMEIRVDGEKFCTALNHIFSSIGYGINNLNPDIQQTINEVCAK